MAYGRRASEVSNLAICCTAGRPLAGRARPDRARGHEMTDQPIGLHRGGPPETVLPPEPTDVLAALEAARTEPDVDARRTQLRAIARAHPAASRPGPRSAPTHATTSRRTRTSVSGTT